MQTVQTSHITQQSAHFAIFRLPHDNSCHAIYAEPQELDDIHALPSRTGFILAPSATADHLPTLLYEGEPEEMPLPAARLSTFTPSAGTPMTDEYHSDFQHLHSEIASGRLRKVVLARSRTTSLGEDKQLMRIFANACAAYPSAFVALVATPHHGTWLMATPELLAESHGGRVRTVALAGTMRKGDAAKQWSAKNRNEQGVVAHYVQNCISPLAAECESGETETITSGELLHLRTTFRFTLPSGKTVADVATALHPTPAVCGMPKNLALSAIKEHEHCQREYYSGFAGPISANGDADLYVTLRCAKFAADTCTLFAGGGLMPESRAQDEWDETEAKMDAIRRIL